MGKNYNDGGWHVWGKAGAPPIHKFTTVDAVISDSVVGSIFLKGAAFWRVFEKPVQVFRVVEEWVPGTPVWVTLNPFRAIVLDNPEDIATHESFGWIKMQEVI